MDALPLYRVFMITRLVSQLSPPRSFPLVFYVTVSEVSAQRQNLYRAGSRIRTLQVEVGAENVVGRSLDILRKEPLATS